MPYQLQGTRPVISPWFFEPPVPYPHWYRYGPDYSRAMFRSESSQGAWIRNPTTVLSGLGDEYTVPWQCWDQPGFKKCQKDCYDKANADKTVDVTKCFKTQCVDPCEKGLASEGGGGGGGGGLSKAASWVSPKTLALGAVGIAVALAVFKRNKAVKKNRRGR